MDEADLMEVLEESLPVNETYQTKQRKQIRGQYQLPKVVATPTLKMETSGTLKANKKELPRTQSFILDVLAPITTNIVKCFETPHWQLCY